MNLNRVFLIGRLTQDPQLRNTPSGTPVCSFGLATNRVWTNRETSQRNESTEYHNIVLWRRLAEIASQYLKKGSLVFIEGRMQTRSWDDPSGVRKYRTEIVAERMQLAPRTLGREAPATQEREQIYGGNKAREEQKIPIIEEGKEETDPVKEKTDQGETETKTNQGETETNEDEGEINVEEIPF